MIDYLAINPADATGFTEIALRKYLDRQSLVWRDGDEGKDPWWYDDYGWWGIAGLKASQHQELFGTYAPCFRGISNLCWQAIYRNAPNVWENTDKKVNENDKVKNTGQARVKKNFDINH
jgi:hypothetical protein